MWEGSRGQQSPWGWDALLKPPFYDVSRFLLSRLSQLLQAGQGSPAEEVPQILAQLPGQAAEASSPSDLLTLLSTMKYLAKAVAKARIQLDRSALKVRSLSHSGCQLGSQGVKTPHLWALLSLWHHHGLSGSRPFQSPGSCSWSISPLRHQPLRLQNGEGLALGAHGGWRQERVWRHEARGTCVQAGVWL